MITSALLSSRTTSRYLLSLVGCAAVSMPLATYGVKLQPSTQNPALFLGIPELCAVLAICTGTIILRPRMWIIDRLGTPTRRWIPAVAAAVTTLSGPQLVLAATAAWLPPRVWPHSATTTLFLASLAVLAAPFLGALRTTGTTLLLYFAANLTSQLADAEGTWSPLSPITWPEIAPLPDWKPILALTACIGAIAVTIRTLGQTMRIWRQRDSADPS